MLRHNRRLRSAMRGCASLRRTRDDLSPFCLRFSKQESECHASGAVFRFVSFWQHSAEIKLSD
jgi:hypothetical protein